jgi:hypothetical protein
MNQVCNVCHKKGFSFSCKCEKVCCSIHRYPEEHTCSFDWKTYEKQKLANSLVKCIATKI